MFAKPDECSSKTTLTGTIALYWHCSCLNWQGTRSFLFLNEVFPSSLNLSGNILRLDMVSLICKKVWMEHCPHQLKSGSPQLSLSKRQLKKLAVESSSSSAAEFRSLLFIKDSVPCSPNYFKILNYCCFLKSFFVFIWNFISKFPTLPNLTMKF